MHALSASYAAYVFASKNDVYTQATWQSLLS
jgi:hypothetical protein